MKMISQKKYTIRTVRGLFGIILQKWENDKEYVVRVPKFPEIVTQGSNIREAKAMAKEAIELCCDCEEKSGSHSHGNHPRIKSKRPSRVITPARF